jgi:hypothetical protein
MFRRILLALIALTASSQRVGLAQELVPSIQFSEQEAAQAKQAVERLSSARDRSGKAELAWKAFRETFRAAHPELRDFQFTSDFRVAFLRQRSSGTTVPDVVVSAVPLTPEQQRQATTAYQEMVDSRQDLKSADQQWRDLQYHLIERHVPTDQEGAHTFESGGTTHHLPEVWAGGIAFTPDFRLGVPAH